MSAVVQDFTTLPVSRFNQSIVNTVKSIRKAKKLLLVEDDTDMSTVLSKYLKDNYNCIVDIAHDPFEAVNYITDKYYDLIILDWQLPGLNGGETLAAAEKALKFEPSIPVQWDRSQAKVVILSSHEKKNCPARKSKHFDYAGHISKMQALSDVVEQIGFYINNEKPGSGQRLALNPMIKFS